MERHNPDRLADVARLLKLDISKDKELQEIVDLAAEICRSSISMITLMDGETQFVKFRSGVDIQEVNYADTFCQFTLKTNDLLMIPDASKDSRLAGNPFVHGYPHLRFYAGVPLNTEKGNAVGTLCVFDTEINSLSFVEQEMLRSLSKQVTTLLEFDVTQQTLKEQYHQSVESANILLTYFQSSSSCHLLMDEEMCALAFNQSMSDLLYANHQTYLAEGMNVCQYVHPDFLNEFITYFQLAASGESISIERQLEYKAGKTCWFLSFETAYDMKGEKIGVSFNATDITGSVNNQERLKVQLQAIKQINDLQSEELISPVDRITSNMAALNSIPELAALPEFGLLEQSMLELLEKKELVYKARERHD